VLDDFTHALGDPAEARLSTALSYITSGASACPVPPSGGLAPPKSARRLSAVDGHIPKPAFLTNRIVRR
jgi:hypothetical protein